MVTGTPTFDADRPYPGVLGRLLRNARMARGWSLRDTERRTEISHGYIGQVERRRRVFRADKVVFVARLFAQSPAELLVYAFHERLHVLAMHYFAGELAALRAAGCRVELRRADGTLVSWQDLGTGEIQVDLRADERALDPGNASAWLPEERTA
jgi:transcriptional regulator with XRE-family HTH domain